MVATAKIGTVSGDAPATSAYPEKDGATLKLPSSQSPDRYFPDAPKFHTPSFSLKRAGMEGFFSELPSSHPEILLLATQELAQQIGTGSDSLVTEAIKQLTTFTTNEWDILKKNEEILRLIKNNLAFAITASANNIELATHFLSDPASGGHDYFKVLVALSFIQSFDHESNLLSTFETEIFSILNKLNLPDDTECPSTLILMTLDTLKASPALAKSSFEWCKNHAEHSSQINKSVLTKLYQMMGQLDLKAAQSYFFSEAFAPLNRTLNPRTQKKQVYSSYYSHVGSAEELARLMGQHSVALRHHINQENNEWGRILEEGIRSNDILLMDVMGIGNVETDNSSYDPTGILQKNLALVHVLRILYHKVSNSWYDPLRHTSPQHLVRFLNPVSISASLNTRLPNSMYQGHHREFDDWLLLLEEKNPDFLKSLSQKIAAWIPQHMTLPIDIFFTEINETEFFQYMIEQDAAMPAYIQLISTLRSWTSGYHGRYLTRFSAFADQDEIRALSGEGITVQPEMYYSRYSHIMSGRRFEKSILPILKEALRPHKDRSGFGQNEVIALMEGFAKNSFHHYLPGWLLQIIDHPFYDETGQEDFNPMQMAFDLLGRSPFSHHQMQVLFNQQGYLNPIVTTASSKRLDILQKLSRACLKKLAMNEWMTSMENKRQHSSNKNNNIIPQIQPRHKLSAEKLARLHEKFSEFVPAPGSYRQYRQLAKRLISTENTTSIELILKAALNQKSVSFPKNAPLAPLIPGPVGQIITRQMLDKALANMTTVATKRRGTVFFSNLLLRWARHNGLDLGQVLNEALSQYTTPQALKILQEELAETDVELAHLRQEIARHQDQVQAGITQDESGKTWSEILNQTEALESKKQQLEKQRDQKLAEIKSDPGQVSDQALFQIINSVYNAIRKQYLKKILIAGGTKTAEVVENHLLQILLPQKNQQMEALMNAQNPFRQHLQSALKNTQTQIDFLFEVLVEVEQQENKRQAP